MQLIACPDCHTQYDVSLVIVERFDCRCGTSLKNDPPRPVDAEIHRCGACGAQVGARAERCAYCGSEIVRQPGELSLICPECYARNADAARFCAGCGVPFEPEPLQAEGREWPCPDCGALMPPSQVAGVPLNECRECRGLWVPGDHFDQLVTQAAERRRTVAASASAAPRVRGANPTRQGVRYRKCPCCDAFMHRRNYRRSSGVIVDECREHGTWLDPDELEQIAGFILSGGATSATFAEEERKCADAAAAAAAARARLAYDPRGGHRFPDSEVDLLDGLVGVLTRIFS